MKRVRFVSGCFAISLLFLVSNSCYYDVADAEIDPDEIISYSADIQPIFNNHCTSCHPDLAANPDLSEGNSYNSITNGTYIIPEDPEGSLLFQRLLGNPSIMPPSGSLSASEIATIRTWIEQGALDN